MSLGGQKLRQRARYGMDAPGVLYGCFAMALLCFVLQAIFPKVTIGGRDWPIGIVFILGQMFFFRQECACCFTEGMESFVTEIACCRSLSGREMR